MAESIVIIGAGIAGLGSAMALASKGRDITIVDRDPPPPSNVETAFETWERKGVTQLRHSHVFLGCLVTLIRKKHPQLHAMLRDAGAREITFEESMPISLRPNYQKSEDDIDMAFLFSRRTTLEYVMRNYVETLPGVRFVTNTRVKRILTTREKGNTTVSSVIIERDDTANEELAGDIIIDATGRNSVIVDALREQGVQIDEEKSPAGILYFTRHYRLKPGYDEPPRDSTPGAGDLGYIKFGVFAADNRHFSITLAVPEIENKLRAATVDPSIFDAICMKIPGTARWVDLQRAEPVTKVFGMGNLFNVWRRFVQNNEPTILNFFAVGDSAIRTNPLYGRGCSSAVLHAHLLADILNSTSDPRQRALDFDRMASRDLRPFWNAIVKQDLGAIRRAQNEQKSGYEPRWKARMIKSFAEDAVGPATRSDLSVYRAIMKGFHMLETPTTWLKNPMIIGKVLLTWATPKSFKSALYPPKLGPDRAEMLSSLGINA